MMWTANNIVEVLLDFHIETHSTRIISRSWYYEMPADTKNLASASVIENFE